MSETPTTNDQVAQDMTLRCRVLSDFFSDQELNRFLELSEGKVAVAIYQALLSASSVAEASRSSGGVSETYATDWALLLKTWKGAAVKEGFKDPDSGVWVVGRE